jgi:hypothetical protein
VNLDIPALIGVRLVETSIFYGLLIRKTKEEELVLLIVSIS